MANFAEWVASQRKARGLSQQELAAKLGMHFRSIGRIEAKGGTPNRNNLDRLADFFEVDREWLRALADGRPLPDADRKVAYYVPMPKRAHDRLVELGGHLNLSPGQVVERILDGLDRPLVDVLLLGGRTGKGTVARIGREGIDIIPLGERKLGPRSTVSASELEGQTKAVFEAAQPPEVSAGHDAPGVEPKEAVQAVAGPGGDAEKAKARRIQRAFNEAARVLEIAKENETATSGKIERDSLVSKDKGAG